MFVEFEGCFTVTPDLSVLGTLDFGFDIFATIGLCPFHP